MKFGLNFGLQQGTFGTGGVVCPQPPGEFLYNWTFDCGDLKWGFDSNYPAIITDNGDGSLHLQSTSNFGSLVPEIGVFPSDNYIISCKIRNISGTGKMSIRRTNNSWHNSPDITTDGIHSYEYSGDIKEIHVGAQADDTYEADYEYISLRKNDGTVTYIGVPVTYNGGTITNG